MLLHAVYKHVGQLSFSNLQILHLNVRLSEKTLLASLHLVMLQQKWLTQGKPT